MVEGSGVVVVVGGGGVVVSVGGGGDVVVVIGTGSGVVVVSIGGDRVVVVVRGGVVVVVVGGSMVWFELVAIDIFAQVLVASTTMLSVQCDEFWHSDPSCVLAINRSSHLEENP